MQDRLLFMSSAQLSSVTTVVHIPHSPGEIIGGMLVNNQSHYKGHDNEYNPFSPSSVVTSLLFGRVLHMLLPE